MEFDLDSFTKRSVSDPLVEMQVDVKSPRSGTLCKKELSYLLKVVYALYKIPGYNERADFAYKWALLAIQEVESQLSKEALEAYAAAPVTASLNIAAKYPRTALFAHILRGTDRAIWALYKFEGDLGVPADRAKVLTKVICSIPHGFTMHVMHAKPLPDLDNLDGFQEHIMQMRRAYADARKAGTVVSPLPG